ncbi:MAG: DEAD/DEAH box helicase, partial [Bacteroidota bacterium]
MTPNNQIDEITDKISFSDELSKLLEKDSSSVSVKHLHGSSKAVTIAALWKFRKQNIFIVTDSKQSAETWYNDLQLYISIDELAYLTEQKADLKFEAQNLDYSKLWLIDGLATLQKKDHSIAIATANIFDVNLPVKSKLEKSLRKIKIGEIYNYEDFINNLALNGFDRKDFVLATGDLAVRGGIIDFFPIGCDNPVRIEFFGDEIESIREFNPQSQRSICNYEQFEFIGSVFQNEHSEFFSTIYDYISPDCIFVLDSPETIEAEYENFELPSQYRKININKLGNADITVNSSPQPKFNKSVQKLIKEIAKLVYRGIHVYLCAEGKIHLERLKELFENSLDVLEKGGFDESESIINDKKRLLSYISWLEQTPAQGFILPDLRLAVFTEHEIFERLNVRKPGNQKISSGGITLQELTQLNLGDFVVHADKGIGRFDGFETVVLGETSQDCVRLSYEDGDILYVHLNYIHKLQKYSAQEGVLPKLTKLGSPEWLKKKSRAKKKIKDIARNLIQLYAKRKMSEGISYPADTIWQKEFEASFIYEDTPDQAQTTSEIKSDMEKISPMDRLVCGDVGFGKTEVAIRAAFKAVQAGKQVAVLVPTTILAQQHFMTFTDRLADYPVNIDVISRFRSKKEQKEITDKLENSQIDILIGTHRILSKDVLFRKLGLLIIDEEHRFGVSAKEKLRELSSTVDTLTLTATPIPRTLNFSLMGARDISVIETAPRNRLPILTEIVEWSDDSIKHGIMHEIERHGQVFFVSDTIWELEKIQMNLQMLMPSVRFGIAHGQMTSTELERTMERFIEKKFDVLITTKIIESGLDIPSANTIFINNSQNFGLA